MDIYVLLGVLPLASSACCSGLAGLQVYRARIHTWTETFFLLSCIFAALYATWDFLFFTAGDKGFARFAGLMSTSSAIVTSLFLLLFTLVYIDRMRRVYWSFGVVTVVVLLLLWLFGLEDVVQVQPLWLPVFNEIVFLIVIANIGAYSLGGIVNLYRLHKIVRTARPAFAGGARGFFIVFAPLIRPCPRANGAPGAPPPH